MTLSDARQHVSEIHSETMCADLLISASPLENVAGKTVSTVFVARDISTSKQTERELDADVSALNRMHALGTRLLGPKGLTPLLQEIVDVAVAVVTAAKGTLLLLERNEVRLAAQLGHTPRFAELLDAGDSRSAVGEVLRKGQRLVVEDVECKASIPAELSQDLFLHEGIRALQATPVHSRDGRLLGVLATYWDAPHKPSTKDLHRIDLLARQTADVVERVRLNEALKEANTRLERRVKERAHELDEVSGQLEEEVRLHRDTDSRRRRMETIARNRQRLALLGELAAGVAHELRNPLQGALAYLELARMHTDDAGRTRTLLDRINDGLVEVDRVASNLLDLARQEIGTPGPERLERLVQKAWNLLAAEAGKRKVHLDSHLTPDLPPVHVYANGLTEALLNLLKNAIDACKEGGRITLHAGLHPEDAEMVQVQIADDGPGIPPEFRERVFDPFFTTKASGQGSGLGLAMVRKMVEHSGGQVYVLNTASVGATIVMELPVSSGQATVTPSASGVIT
jgi:signal transduction histidine kinase